MIDLDAGSDAATDAQEEGITETTTADNWNCTFAPSHHASAPHVLAVALVAIAMRGRRRRWMLALAGLFAGSTAHAQAAVDEEPREPDPPMRRVAIEWNPMSLLVTRYGPTIEVLLASHHALTAGAYYVYSATNSDTNNVFSGVGGEVGYRFYLGKNGFRGFYVGPSFLVAGLSAQPQTGPSISFFNVGGALDAGWQALVADRVLVGLGAGAEYTIATKTFPQQQIPASVYANSGFRPRVNIAIGVAF